MRIFTSKMKNHSESEKSFTLLEVVIVLGILSVGITVPFLLISRTLMSFSYSTSQITAVYLAQEGIEIARNIRDSAWIAGSSTSDPWDRNLDSDYLHVCEDAVDPESGGCWWNSFEVDYRDPSLSLADFIGDCEDRHGFFQGFLIDSNGFFCESGSPGCSGTGTLFKRGICTIRIDADLDTVTEIVMVRSWVFWDENGKEFEVLAQENLYNWH